MRIVTTLAIAAIAVLDVARADDFTATACRNLPTQQALQAALIAARAQANGGFNLDMWGTIVNRDGVVCAVAFTGADRGDQWPGSRVISAQKANTANSLQPERPGAFDGKLVYRRATRRQSLRVATE